MDEAEEKTYPPTDSKIQPDAVSPLDLVTCELREDLEHEKGRIPEFGWYLSRVGLDQEKDMTEFTVSQHENERADRFLFDDLEQARQVIYRLRGEISELQSRAESQHREHKYR